MHHEQTQAARAVTRVFEGANLRDALAEVDDGTPMRGRSLVQELAYGTLRHWGPLNAVAGKLLGATPEQLRTALGGTLTSVLDAVVEHVWRSRGST